MNLHQLPSCLVTFGRFKEAVQISPQDMHFHRITRQEQTADSLGICSAQNIVSETWFCALKPHQNTTWSTAVWG